MDFGIFQYEDGRGVRKLAADAETCSLSDYVRIGNGSAVVYTDALGIFGIARDIPKNR